MTIPQMPDDFDKWHQYSEEHNDGPAWAVRVAPYLIGGFVLACVVLAVYAIVWG